MPKVTQSKFDGGQAEDIRTTATDQNAQSLNFDIFTNPHKLLPYGDSVAETTATDTMATITISDIDVAFTNSAYRITGLGNETNASTKLTFWLKSAIAGAVNWTSSAVSATGAYLQGSGVVYKDFMFGISTDTLFKYAAAGTSTSIGTFGTTKPFVHPEEQVIYGMGGTTIYRYDNSSITTNTSLLPTGITLRGLTDYGTYLVITTTPARGNGNSISYLWDRNMSDTTFQGSINWGEGNLISVENLDGNLFAIMTPQNALLTALTNKIIIRQYSGGQVVEIKSLTILSTQSISVTKHKNGNKIYFGLNNDYAVYAFGKNKEGNYIVSQDRFYNNGTVIGSALYALQMIGDIMWRGFSTAGSAFILMRSLASSGESIAYTSTSIYKTTINPSMPLADRDRKKKLKYFKIYYTGVASGTVGVKYLVDGKNSSNTTTFESILSESTTAIEDYRNATQLADNQAFAEGVEYQFQLESTGGVQIKSYEYDYDIIND